jgi:hypothetical protein
MSDDGQLTFDDALGKFQREGQSVTSRVAAIEAVPITGKARTAVFQVIKQMGNYGATDEEIQATLDMNPSTQRPRRVELVEQGWIKDSGRTRTTRSKRQAVVWIRA